VDPSIAPPERQAVIDDVSHALAEDLEGGDVTACLVPEGARLSAAVIAREEAVLCGRDWFDEVFHQLDPQVRVDWDVADGDAVSAGQRVCRVGGPARPMLSGERSALNFLQTLSGTATLARQYAAAVAGTDTRVLDTRKTVPGLRRAQKYAVRCGGCYNHRMSLHDAVLIKENHIAAAGSVVAAIRAARRCAPAGVTLEVEVEDLEQLRAALGEGATRILCDNFPIERLRAAVELSAGRAALEASGNVSLDTVREIAATGVDYVSVGSLTKHVRAIDLSMRFLAGEDA